MLLFAALAVNVAWRMDEQVIETARLDREKAVHIAYRQALTQLETDLSLAAAFVDRGIREPSSDATTIQRIFAAFIPALVSVQQGVLQGLSVHGHALSFSWQRQDAHGTWLVLKKGAWRVRALVRWSWLFAHATPDIIGRDWHIGVRWQDRPQWIYRQHAVGEHGQNADTRLARNGHRYLLASSFGRFELILAPSSRFIAKFGHPRTWLVGGGALVTLLLIGGWLHAERRAARLAQRRKWIARAMLDAIPFPISFLDRTGRYVEFNRALTELLGRSFAEIKQSTPIEMWGKKIWEEEIRPHFERALAGAIAEHEFFLRGRCYLGTFTPWRDKKGAIRGVIVVTRDITERKLLEKERIEEISRRERARRWEDLGHLAGGVAHDLNNMLTAAMSAVEHAFDAPESTRREALNSAIEVMEQAGRLCRQLLIYAGKGKAKIERIHPAEMISDAAQMLETAREEDVTLIVEAPKLMPMIEGDRAQLIQALFNLGLNALQAVSSKKGWVKIEAKAIDGNMVDWQAHECPKAAQAVVFSVQDNGPGIPPEMRDKLFTPFFTTREEGTGMGLAVVHGIARAHHGFVEVESNPGQGACFRLVLPATKEWRKAHKQPSQRRARRAVQSVRRHALVVDDEPMVRRLQAMAVQRLGFVPIEASNGEEAVRIVQERPDLAFVLMDVRMPKINGVQAMREIRALAPSLPVVLMSGATSDPVPLESSPPDVWLNKPFRFSELEDALARIGVLAPTSAP